MSDLDLLTVGRVNFDLYAQELGVDFHEVGGWDAMIGGSPANVALAAARLGVRAGVFTAVGDDLVGDWVLSALEREDVNTAFVHRKFGPHTSLALRAQLRPDHPLVFYRHDPADVHLTLEDAAPLPLEGVRAVLVSGDALARGSAAEAADWILRRARALGKAVYIDLDLRHVNWPHLDTYAATVGAAIRDADVVLGTTAEFAALLRLEPDDDEEAVSQAVRDQLATAAGQVLILKRGELGATFFLGEEHLDVPAFAVPEASTVGAGDSFAAGLIHARLNGLEWREAGRFASACGAITVSRFGCSRGFPRLDEIAPFLDQQLLTRSG